MCDGWVTTESLIAAGKKVGVYKDGLSVNFMQTDRFEQAERCVAREGTSQTITWEKKHS